VVKRSQLEVENVDQLALAIVNFLQSLQLGILLLKLDLGLLEEDGKIVAA
jgi:hypothetical protein